MIAITGATGQLGRLVLEHLVDRISPSRLIAVVRDPAKAAEIAAKGIAVRKGDYSDRASLEEAFAGVDKVLLISSNALGQRAAQHLNVIEAAKKAGVKLLAYTSVLHADRSVLGLAKEHFDTENALKASGLPFIILRNGWYTENYTAAIPAALANGAVFGSAGNGRISSATRADYAEATAVLLAGAPDAGTIFELAGDESYTLAEFAAELSRQAGREIPYHDLPEAEYAAALQKAGLPEPVAHLLADSDAGAAKGALFDDGHQLGTLLGRPTTPLEDAVRQALIASEPQPA